MSSNVATLGIDVFESDIQLLKKHIAPQRIINKLNNKNITAFFYIISKDKNEIREIPGFFISDTGIGISQYCKLKGDEIIRTYSGAEVKIGKVLKISKKLNFVLFETDVDFIVNYIKLSESYPEVGETVVFLDGNSQSNSDSASGIIIDSKPGNINIQIISEKPFTGIGLPLVNTDGKLIGITTYHADRDKLYAVKIQKMEIHSKHSVNPVFNF